MMVHPFQNVRDLMRHNVGEYKGGEWIGTANRLLNAIRKYTYVNAFIYLDKGQSAGRKRFRRTRSEVNDDRHVRLAAPKLTESPFDAHAGLGKDVRRNAFRPP